ncbi:c-type cytochrome [Vibrio bivalvicida]|uniref:Cytochrome c n=1 Tax=Vibrio bivalvicida TaxID=1276888 RepID=A0ABV4MH79_9VIBR
MIRTLPLLLFIPSLALASNQFGDPESGKIKSPSCVFCHGQDGTASNPAYPHLKGQNAQYLFKSMKDYQDGNRTGALAEMMKVQLSRLNDQDLKDISAYFSSQE